jgi:hypothetical protein
LAVARGGCFFFRFRGIVVCIYLVHVRTLAQGHSGDIGEGVGGGNKNRRHGRPGRGYFAGAAPQPHGAQRGVGFLGG